MTEKTEQERDEEFAIIIIVIVILVALALGYKNREKIREKITELVESFK